MAHPPHRPRQRWRGASGHHAPGQGVVDCVVVLAPSPYLGEVEATQTQRKLLYVALTRARRGAMLVRVG